MPANLLAFIYVIVAVIAAHFLCVRAFRSQKQVVNRITLGWVLLSGMLFLTPSVPLYFITIGVVLIAMAPKSVDDRLQFYFAMLPIVPLSANWQVSLPGVEALITLDHVRLLTLVLLVPLYFQQNYENNKNLQNSLINRRSRKAFGIFFTFLVFAMLLEFRGQNLTEILRGLVERSLHELLLVIIVFKLCKNRNIIDKLLFAILVSGVSVAFISCVEAATSWVLYNEINPSFFIWGLSPMAIIADFRGGVMRTPVMMQPIPLGVYMSICLVLNYYFSGLKKRGNAAFGSSLIISCFLLAALVFSGSRGAWAMTGSMFILIIILQNRFRILKWIVGLCCVIAMFLYPAIMRHLVANDPYGTFQYRIDLFNNSLITIKDSIFLGSVHYFDHPAMQASRQGQGIIDIVNTYVGMALAYGVPMLVLFIYVILSVIRKLSRIRKQAENVRQMQLLEWQARIVLAMIVGGFGMIVTVSLVDRISHYLWVSLILGICIYRYGYCEIREKNSIAIE